MKETLIALLLFSSLSFSKGRYVPADEMPLFYSIGIGFGAPYALAGFGTCIGNDFLSADMGFGYIGVGPSISGGFSGYFTRKHTGVRPKFSIYFMNFATIVIPEGEKASNGEMYPGLGFFGGLDFRLGRTTPLCIDVGIGYVHTFKKFEDIKQEWFDKQYILDKDAAKVRGYLGLRYSIGRKLKYLMH